MSMPRLAVWAALLLLLAGEPATAQNVSIQLPQFGVAVDAEGVLSVTTHTDPTGRLHAMRLADARAKAPADLAAASDTRKISLVRLERAIRAARDAGRDPDDAMKHLAGLQRLQYVFFYPDENDIVIAGPAEAWVDDGLGRLVGVTTGKPVVILEDLIVALRAFAPGGPVAALIGCSIDPNREGLARLQALQRNVPRSVPIIQREEAASQIAQGMLEALGMARIRVFGVSPRTHFAHVLIEADYRMKLIGIGLEPPPVRMATYISSLSGARHSTLQRWWFTPNYDCVCTTDDGLAMELVGQGVQLQCETNLVGADGSLALKGAKPDKASELFTLAFTRKYPQIAEASPVYAQMRNLIDLTVAAAYIRKHDFYSRAGWSLGVFADEDALPVETHRTPEQAPCAVNSVWKGSRVFTPAGGGVSIRPEEALSPERIQSDERGQLARQYNAVEHAPADRWWWD
jgi:hypothetical protein